ncbi:MAG: RimK/LysX family protein [Desulfobacterales bacterium]
MIIMGWVEKIRISSDGPYLKAKLDTGALTSSLHARDIEYLEKDGQKMVRFVVIADCARSDEKVEITFEKPLKRKVRIRQHQGEPMRRPVVIMDFCIGGKLYSTPFSLTSRSNFNYPVLLGRKFLKGRILVDSGHSFLMSRVCPEQ